MKIKVNPKVLLTLLVFFLFNGNIFAAGGDLDGVMSAMTIVTIVTVLFIAWLVVVYAELDDVNGEKFLKPLRIFNRFITRSTPMEKEHEILLDHDYDGIRELDNKVPPWFNFLFYGTIFFSIVYLIQFHVIGSGNVQEEEYQAEMQAAAMQQEILIRSGALLDENSVKFADDAATLSSGKEIYMKNCASCHANDGGGLVGPNLTDKYWIHGGGIVNVFKTVKYGVPQKGMISWQTQLSPTEMQEVSSYILTMEGTTPAAPKQPEGEIWVPEEENVDDGTKES
ncbi:MAG: hypothetical protein SCALA702_37680 [Melioribacteraceae bacterium]|nr:MAG: hypothetical protein SCALA702_37680 [Melioribacteraceae bacterium]